MFDYLFSPIKVRETEFRNRIIMPAMGTRMAERDGSVSERLTAYHRARAAGGCGLNLVEVSAVHSPSAPAFFVSLSEDRFVEGHRKLTKAVHEAGGKAGVQLWQGSIAASMDANGKAELLVASDMEMGPWKLKAVTTETIGEVVKCYGKAAERAVEAGYDCVEFHCAHNYLPHSFLSGGINRRTDEYGGSFENRVRFPLQCIRAIRQAIPEGMPLFMRIDAHDDNLDGGLTIEETIAFCSLAGKAGVDVLDVSRGNIITAASVYEVPPIDIPRGFNVENASRIRRETGMLTMAVGRINHADQAERILQEGKADFAGMGRAQLADPDFCRKAKDGRVDDIVHCIGCNQGCYDGFCDLQNRPFITCLRNPGVGYEDEQKLIPAETPKKVMIAGGGMGGMEAAVILKQRGHDPAIYESSDRLGGQFITAGMAPGKGEMMDAAVSFGEQVLKAGIAVHFHTAVIPERIREEKPDEVIVAVGAAPIELKLPGMDKLPLWQANRVLRGEVQPEGSVCVIGGGLVGLETADALAEAGCQVTVLEMKDAVGEDLGALRKIAVMQKLNMLHVEFVTGAVCKEITPDGVKVEKEGKTKVIACGCVVAAIGARPNESKELVEECRKLGIPCHVIGDARQARRALNAVAEGYEIAGDIGR